MFTHAFTQSAHCSTVLRRGSFEPSGEMAGHVKSLMLGGIDEEIANELGLFDLLDLGHVDMEDAITAMGSAGSVGDDGELRAPPTPDLPIALSAAAHEDPPTSPPIPVPSSPVRPFTSSSLHPISCPASPTSLIGDGGTSGPEAEASRQDQSQQRTLTATSLANLTELMGMLGSEAVTSEVGDVFDLGVTDQAVKNLPHTQQTHSQDLSTNVASNLDIVDGVSVYHGSGETLIPDVTGGMAGCSTQGDVVDLTLAVESHSAAVVPVIGTEGKKKKKEEVSVQTRHPSTTSIGEGFLWTCCLFWHAGGSGTNPQGTGR